MTPSRSELLDRAYELRELFDEIEESQGLSVLDSRVVRLIKDVIEEMESC
jgi:hypothetical protein